MLNYELRSQGTRCQISKDTESTSHNTVVFSRVLWIGHAFTCNCSDYLLIRPLSASLNGLVHSQFVLRVILSILRRPKNRGSWVSFVLVPLVTAQGSHSQGKAGNRREERALPLLSFPLLLQCAPQSEIIFELRLQWYKPHIKKFSLVFSQVADFIAKSYIQ